MKTLQIVSVVAWVMIAVVGFDALGFVSWVASGQHPVDDFYVGSLTAHALAAVIK